MDMVNNFEILMDFKNVRDFAICASKNGFCCHRDTVRNCFSNIPPSQMQNECRKCWLDFLTADEGLNLSYLDKDVSIECKTSPIKLSKKSMKILEDKKNGNSN